MVREVTCWPIAYQQNVCAQDSRNIGVLLSEAGQSEILLMGCDPSGRVDPAYFCKAFGHDEGAGWVYREWVRWFQKFVAEATSDEEIEVELARLKRSGSHFGAGESILISAPLDEPIATVAARVFHSLVETPKLSKRPSSFLSAVEHLIDCSEIEYRAPFHRNIELEIQSPDQPKFVQLAYFVETASPLGIKLLRFQGKSAADVAAQVSDLRYVFDTLIANEILEASRCVVLHDAPNARLAEHLRRLEGDVVLLPLADGASAERLRNMVPFQG